MMLNSEREVITTQAKLERLEALYEACAKDPAADEELQQAEMQSLKRLINQFKEEIARFQARQPARRAPLANS